MCAHALMKPSQIAYKSRVLGSSRPEEDWSVQLKPQQDKFEAKVVYQENLHHFHVYVHVCVCASVNVCLYDSISCGKLFGQSGDYVCVCVRVFV